MAILGTCHDYYTHELRPTVGHWQNTCTRSSQLKIAAWRGRDLKSTPLSEEVLAVHGCWGKGSHFSLGLWQLVDLSCSSRWPYWTTTFMEDMKLRERWEDVMGDLGKEFKGDEGWIWSRYICTNMRISKNKNKNKLLNCSKELKLF